MKKNLLKKISVKSVATFISIALLITGICCVGTEGNVVQAAAPEAAVSVNGEGYYVKDFTGAQFNAYKEEGTYPKMVTKKDDDVQEWLFAGWYQKKDDAKGTCTNAYDSATTTVATSATVYAKFVPASVMAVKCQVTPETDVDSEKANMRLISTTDSADYVKMGFKVSYKGRELDCYTTTLYKRVAASDDGMECNYSANAFDNASNYFFAVRLTNIGNTNFAEAFYIEPYWVTADGTTVTGVSRYARVEDSYEKIVNLPVRLYSDEKVTSGEVSLSYDATRFDLYAVDGETKIAGTVFDTIDYERTLDEETNVATLKLTGSNTEVDDVVSAVDADGIFANIRLQLKEGQLIESNTSFEVTNESFSNGESNVTLDVANILYKNYAMDYAGKPDTSWYDEFKGDNTFVISTAADLYGLATIVNDTTGTYQGEQFSEDQIILGADIVINSATLDPDAEDWATVSATCAQWTPIGTTNAFAGTFDGQGHAISGVYLTDTDKNKTYGLFGTTATESTLKSFRLKNSYFKGTFTGRTPFGSVVGLLNGKIEEIYSDAFVVSNRGKLGGLVGSMEQDNATTSGNITSCWFDGAVLLNKAGVIDNNEAVGGIVGGIYTGTLYINDCVNTGSLLCTYESYDTKNNKAIAGVVGRLEYGTISATNIVMAGTIDVRYGNETDGYTTLTGDSGQSGRGIALCLGYGATDATMSLTNAYCMENNDYGCNRSTVTEKNVNTLSANALNGHVTFKNTVALGYYDEKTNPSGNWVVRATATDLSDGVPVPKCFADNDTIDVAWYYEKENHDAGNNTFTINTKEELYAFADIASTYNFANDTVTLGADIVANTGNASAWSVTTRVDRNWTPIGTVDNPFAGKFDGQGHTISGVYLVGSDTSKTYGLFGTTVAGSLLKDFRLKNSHFELIDITTQTSLGSVVGVLNGDLENVYSDANIVSVLGKIGGLVGSVNHASDSAINHITNCWHNGKIELNKNAAVANYEYVGGVVGLVNKGNLQITSCLKTGEIKASFAEPKYTGNKSIGGLVGRALGNVSISDTIMSASMLGQYMSDGAYITMTGEKNSGEDSGRGISLSVGFGTDTSITLTNVYCRNSNQYMISWKNGTNSSNYSNRLTQSQLNGHVAYSNTCAYNNETDTHQGINYYHPDNNPTGAWVIREKADNVANGCPIPKVFADEWINVAWYYDNVTAATDDVTSPADTYTISTPEEMYGLSVISAFDTFENDTISLANDIEMNSGLVEDWINGQIDDVRIWTPIGTDDYDFAGIFDGGMHTISGVYIDTEQQGAGLFRTTAQGSKIQNLRLVNSYINSEYSSTYGCVGSLVGSCAGSLENIYSDAYVVSKSSASGGLVGELWSDEDVSVKQCWFDGEMNVVANSGGLIGMYSVTGCTLTMENCLNSGTISYNNKNYIGGLIGRTLPSTSRWCADTNGAKSFITMENCLNYGELSPSPNDKSAAGSVLGQLENCELTLTSVYATNESYIDSTTSTSEYLGNNKKCVLNGEATLDAKNNFEGLEVTSDIFAPLGTGAWVPTLEMPVPAVFADYVAAIDVAWYEKGVGGTINTRAQLWGLSYLSQKQSIDGTITLGADIDLNPGWTASETSEKPCITWTSVGTSQYPFAGKFDGDGHTISGVYLEGNQQYIGLFGRTANGSEITNFRLENSYIYNSSNYTGSIVGYLKGNLSKVYSNAIVTSGASRLGGLVAFVEPISATDERIQITDCWFDGKIIGSNGGQYLGGLISTIRGGTCNMENILFTGQIESDYNGSNYAYIGGIVADVGYDTNNTILNLESVVSAGSIISHWKPNYVHAVVGNARKYGDNTEPQLVMTNVFATRDCYETPYGGNAEKSGVVARTTGADRLIGISSYEDENPDGETTCHLDFSEWSMRVDDVPIPTCFSNLSKVKDTVIAGFEPESLAKEIGLDYWDSDAKITDATFYGAGNYVIPYVATEEQYNEYISILATEEGTETESGYTGLGFTECITNAGTDMAADGVYAQTYCKEATAESGEWVLNLTYVKNLSKIYISVNTDVESIAPTLEADNDLAMPDETGDEAISLSMLEIMANSDGESNGNSFVFQLPNKHFIVIDGGREADGTKLVEYLRGQVGEGQDVVIDAWFITHYHADHSGALKAFYKDSSLRENVYLEAIYACEPSSYALDWKEDDQQLTGTNEALRGAKILTKKSDGTKPDVYQLHMGQKYYFYGMTMDVIDTQEQRHVSTWGTQAPDDFNASSTNCVFTFKDKNSDIKKVLIGGDATNTNMQYIVQAFGENTATLSDIDAFVAYHHGLNTTIDYIGHPNLGTANYTWSNFLLENNNNKFEVVFFPYYKIYQNGDEDLPSSVYPDNIGDINTYLCNHADAYYTYGYGDCLEEYNKENRHGTVKITFDGNNTATVYQSGLFTNTTE